MATGTAPSRTRGLGMASLVFGLLGLVTFWWVPLGMVLSLAGLIIGLTGWIIATRKSTNFRSMVGGTALSAVALIVDLACAAGGFVWIWFSPLR